MVKKLKILSLFLLLVLVGCGGGGGTPPSPPAPRVYSVYIDSEPRGAMIYLNNVSQNKETLALIENLSEGQHTLKLTMKGWKDYVETINVIANDTIKMSLQSNDKPEGGEEEFLPPNLDFMKL